MVSIFEPVNYVEELKNLKTYLKYEKDRYNYYKSETRWIDNIMILSNEHRLELLAESKKSIEEITLKINELEKQL